MHYVEILDEDKMDLVDLVPACGEICAESYCREHGIPYEGWNGCHEGADYPEYCGHCGTRVSVGLESECDSDCLPFVVGTTEHAGKVCAHGVPLGVAPGDVA